MTFQKEADFEEALIKVLADKGWEKEVIKNPTEQDLIRNWAKILYDNNRGIDRLNNYPLTDGEMQQIIEQITELRTPLKLNGFINGKTVSIKRDNPDDKLHFGTEISLKIYDRREIAAGQSRYQIVQQPAFPSKSKMLNDRRGDLMLLINGMPVIHIELKRSGVPVSQAYNQIEKYSYEGVFTGLFSLVQVFVAMNPEETRYFANPGPDGKFNTDYYFHWADFNNEPINDWKAIASSLLSIPMAHQLIGFYTVADNADGVLKVMRSYQYYAASAISDVVSKTKWDSGKQRGGYIWHTTGSGKTMTSFKSAQLIANSNDADKVIFLTDRIELGTQSLKEYRAFADENETVQATENTYVLLTKLKSNATADTLIVTSIQKMSNIRDEDGGLNASDIEIINGKRLVFIVDEAHRSTFGDMLSIIKETFPNAIFFGFTGTPVFEENAKKNNAKWITVYKKGAIRKVTMDKYLMTQKWLVKLVPNLRVCDMNRIAYQQLLNDYAEFHERQTTMDFHHQLKGAILDAVDEGLIERDPTRKAIIKGKPPVAKKIKYLNQFELHTLLISLDLKDKVNWDYFILLVAKTGMRFSEALALTPKDFDFAHQTLSISKTWDYKGKGGFQPTKNKSSVRKIQIDWQTVIQFSELVKHLPEDKPIFVNSTVYNSTVNDILGRHCKACNIPVISIHGLRHTHASLLLFTGVSIASVARRLGHSSMTTTQKTYLHIIQELENKDIDLVMRSLSGLS